MRDVKLKTDPFNVIITGVGGQGNVMASRVMGGMLSRKDLNVTIGDTFGASQRGG
jgi:indolepyruvate ferredoxin oxidoreductase beta subunit